MPYCPHCGTEVEASYLFCPECGCSLREIPREPVGFFSVVKNGLSSLLVFRSPPPLLRPTDVVYERRPPYSPVRRYLLIGVVIGVVGMFLINEGYWLTYWGVTLMALVPPLLYLLWMRRNDRYEEEPWGLVLFVVGWGIFVGIFAALLNDLLMISLLGTPGAAFTEEPLKVLGVYLLARHKKLGREFNDHMDGMVYGAGAGAGFALMENFHYIFRYSIQGAMPLPAMTMVRAVSALGHLLYTGLTGRVLGYAKARRGYIVRSDFIAALIPAVILHFLWNASPAPISLFILAPLYALIFYRNVKAAQRDEELWGFRIRAPWSRRITPEGFHT
ncbi:MAG: hypothetical protein AYL28_004550 [Candidatus Bathyarchaeota archaeon B23]|nr:MAG: hypothetical protein AYL28_004550 [Candidatus Bathyarchaeota archaeon B23]